MAILECNSEQEANNITEPKFVWFNISKWIVFTGEDMRNQGKPIISLPAHKAFVMLENLGILSQCRAICQALGATATISFEKAPEIRSDNPLVHAVLGPGGLGKTEEEIYQMFVNANELPI